MVQGGLATVEGLSGQVAACSRVLFQLHGSSRGVSFGLRWTIDCAGLAFLCQATMMREVVDGLQSMMDTLPSSVEMASTSSLLASTGFCRPT